MLTTTTYSADNADDKYNLGVTMSISNVPTIAGSNHSRIQDPLSYICFLKNAAFQTLFFTRIRRSNLVPLLKEHRNGFNG